MAEDSLVVVNMTQEQADFCNEVAALIFDAVVRREFPVGATLSLVVTVVADAARRNLGEDALDGLAEKIRRRVDIPLPGTSVQ